MWEASWVPSMLLTNVPTLSSPNVWRSSAEVWCKLVSGPFRGNVLCWCRSVTTSMVSLCYINSLMMKTSAIAASRSGIAENSWEADTARWIFPWFFVLHSLAYNLDWNFSCVGSADLSVHPNQIQRFHACISALLQWYTFVDTRMYPAIHVTRPTQDLRAVFPPLSSSQSLPPPIKIWSYWRGISGTGVAISSTECNWSFSLSFSRSAFRIVAINFGRYLFNNVVCFSGFIQLPSQASWAWSSKLSKTTLILRSNPLRSNFFASFFCLCFLCLLFSYECVSVHSVCPLGISTLILVSLPLALKNWSVFSFLSLFFEILVGHLLVIFLGHKFSFGGHVFRFLGHVFRFLVMFFVIFGVSFFWSFFWWSCFSWSFFWWSCFSWSFFWWSFFWWSFFLVVMFFGWSFFLVVIFFGVSFFLEVIFFGGHFFWWSFFWCHFFGVIFWCHFLSTTPSLRSGWYQSWIFNGAERPARATQSSWKRALPTRSWESTPRRDTTVCRTTRDDSWKERLWILQRHSNTNSCPNNSTVEDPSTSEHACLWSSNQNSVCRFQTTHATIADILLSRPV